MANAAPIAPIMSWMTPPLTEADAPSTNIIPPTWATHDRTEVATSTASPPSMYKAAPSIAVQPLMLDSSSCA